MIAPLRRRHRVMTGVLFVVVPIFYVLALLARPDDPVMTPLPAVFTDEAEAGEVEAGQVVLERQEVVAGTPLLVRWRAGGDASPVGPSLELAPAAALLLPEVLVYWSAAPVDRPGDGAFLLGGLAGERARTFPLPPAAATGGGWLLFYSLAHQETVGTVALPLPGEGGSR